MSYDWINFLLSLGELALVGGLFSAGMASVVYLVIYNICRRD